MTEFGRVILQPCTGSIRYDYSEEERDQIAWWHVVQGVPQAQVSKEFLINPITIHRWCKKLRHKIAQGLALPHLPDNPLPPVK